MQRDYIAMARGLLSDTTVIESLRSLAPKDDQERERLYWYGYENIRGSVAAALYPLIKLCQTLSNADIASLALGDEERVRLLAKNRNGKMKIKANDR